MAAAVSKKSMQMLSAPFPCHPLMHALSNGIPSETYTHTRTHHTLSAPTHLHHIAAR